MASWRGRGKGREPGQPSVPGIGGIGAGGGRKAAQPSVPGTGGAGAGQGRAGSQPSVGTGSLLGTRSADSTTQMTNNSKGVDHVADPEGNFIFALEIDSIEVAQFLECSGLKSSTEIFELQEGGMNHRVHKLPGQSRWENITLRYGVTNDVSLMQWRDEILQDEFGSKSRRNGSIVVKNNQMEVVRRYNFVDAWPVTWEGPNLSASGAELAIEMVELAHHGVYVS